MPRAWRAASIAFFILALTGGEYALASCGYVVFLELASTHGPRQNVLGFFKRNAQLVSRIGGVMLVTVGLLEATGAWTSAIAWLHTHWFTGFKTSL